MILVFGSINADLIVPVPRLPQPGETVLGGDYTLLPGGKGANQALAARRAGAANRAARHDRCRRHLCRRSRRGARSRVFAGTCSAPSQCRGGSCLPGPRRANGDAG